MLGCVGCFCVSDTAQVELKSGRVKAPAVGSDCPGGGGCTLRVAARFLCVSHRSNTVM